MESTGNHYNQFVDQGNCPQFEPDRLDEILEFDTCAIANAIESFRVRLRNQGFTGPGLSCVTGGLPRALGYAATFRVRSADPPMTGDPYFDRTDWWGEIQALPKPRIAVIEDLDAHPGGGGSVGEVHAAILKAFGCVAVITNGAVRDLPQVQAMGFPMFSHGVAVSHAYRHIVDFGQPARIFGLEIRSCELLYADCHGVVSIPAGIASRVAAVARKNRTIERQIIEVCLSPDFSEERLRQIIQGMETR